ncbi:MAG: hypothetical protein DBY18_04565 [Clostridia bacterium]|nr:MAG: hypothetical protein DBY18_04565 [Clostridia bacterium]
MANKSIHITPRPYGWAVKSSGSSRASSLHPTKAQAYEVGRKSAISNKTELFVHNRDGRFGYRNSYGNDPYPPRG